MKSYKRRAGPIPFRAFYKIYQVILDRLLKRPPAQVHVACFRTQPGQVFAWIAYEKSGEQNYVHYVYSKEAFRGLGLATALIEHATSGGEFTYTFRPRKHAWLVNRGGHFDDRFIRQDLPDE
jgi:GNAT superfamily N-acetyltransferase